MRTWVAAVADVPFPLRGAVLGAIAFGGIGAVVGLVVGLLANPGTAWFAVFELGIPAAFVGALLGLMVGTLAWLSHRLRRRG